MDIVTLLIIGICFVSLLIFSLLKLEWLIKELRDICLRPQGFFKLGQLTFIFFSWGSFLSILVYYAIKETQINALNIFLTIVVGFLGTIMGVLFSQEVIKKIYESRVIIKDDRLKHAKLFLKELKTLVKENINLKKEKERQSKI